jgi:CheY-like chemotaxis protein
MDRANRILVVDDNEASAKVFALALSLHGYDVREAYSGKMALETARTFRPNIAFLDLGIPMMDGFEIATQLKLLPEMSGVFLVAITGFQGDEHRARSRAVGFRHHLVKPVEPESILNLLKESGFPSAKNN